MTGYEQQKNFIKSNFLEFKKIKTDKMKGIPKPRNVKPYHLSSTIIDLPVVNEEVVKSSNVFKCIKERRSTRFYSQDSISLSELSYLLRATQGITSTNKS
ncbi:hypothetical protein R4Z09_17670 [Niallia oryzisoli]|uniref:Uncharacterized protein n=1 Tax=Niallia oryzisoli TaxID=1737571 RepID=A0ABZ2CA60_9BACI